MADRKHRVHQQLTITEAARALHLDFEGFKKGPPVFAGIRVDGEWTATVFGDTAPLLVPAARAEQGRECVARHGGRIVRRPS